MTIYGTRPEAIKVAPVVRALEASGTIDSITVVTGQHRQMLDQVHAAFGIMPDHDLDVFTHGQGLNALMGKVLTRLDPLLDTLRPDAVLVQGDTSTVAAAAIAAFHHHIPVLHLEAGLRSGALHAPFPEEANRKLTSQVTALHLAPTASSRANLERENVDPDSIVVTGNTVIDGLLHVSAQHTPFEDERLRELVDSGRRIVLVTAHRRESWGEAMVGVGRALRRIAQEFPDAAIVLPVHLNPLVREAVLPQLEGLDNVLVLEPLPYGEFAQLMAHARVVLTDSGGIQEEAPSLGKPVLVLRDRTERPEAVDAGTVRLVGTDEGRIVREVATLLTDEDAWSRMANAVNPYGDGRAAERALAAIEAHFDLGDRLPDFGC